MVLSNYYKCLAHLMMGLTDYSLIKRDGTEGSTASLSHFTSHGVFAEAMSYIRTSYANTKGTVFGTGTTPPTVDDCTLSGSLVTGISGSVTKSVSVQENSVILTAVYTLINNGTEDVTIGEMALFWNYTGSSTATYSILTDRTLLDEPITIPTGGVGQVTYTITMNIPTE